MADREITDPGWNPVVTPTPDDIFICQQGGVTKKITAEQILSNIANFDNAATLTGGETIFCKQGSDSKKITIATLADYIISES